MSDLHFVLGVAVVASLALASVTGAFAWWRAMSLPAFWAILRFAQAAVLAQIALGVVLMAAGDEPPGLHALYGALPVAVSFLAEQLRVLAAEQVMAARGFTTAKDLAPLPEAEQQAVVTAIVRRETGVMALAAISMLLLVLRAADEAGAI